MTDQELEARVEASRADWYARAADLGITTAAAEVPADTWAALNPGTDWAADEDRARTEHHDPSEWFEKYGTAGSLKREDAKETWALENRAINAEIQAVAAQQASEFRQGWEDACRQVEAEDRAAELTRYPDQATQYTNADADVA